MQLWIDLETTGLDPDDDRIIEVGWMLTDHHEIVEPVQSVNHHTRQNGVGADAARLICADNAH